MIKSSVYSDGSSKIGEDAGWASVLYINENKPIIFYGHIPKGTNNQGELIGLICGALLVKKAKLKSCCVWSDSQYSIGVLTKNWNAMENQDIVHLGRKMLRKMNMSRTRLYVKWVKGHSGVEGNELADKFAKYGRLKQEMLPNDAVVKYFEDLESIMNYLEGAL